MTAKQLRKQLYNQKYPLFIQRKPLDKWNCSLNIPAGVFYTTKVL